MGTIYVLFKELRSAVENNGSWNGENFVRSQEQEEEIQSLFEQLDELLEQETSHLVCDA